MVFVWNCCWCFFGGLVGWLVDGVIVDCGSVVWLFGCRYRCIKCGCLCLGFGNKSIEIVLEYVLFFGVKYFGFVYSCFGVC